MKKLVFLFIGLVTCCLCTAQEQNVAEELSIKDAIELDDALAVFEQNTTDYSASFNTWDSLAEAYMKKENKQLAIKYYKKSLELNPNNINAVTQLKKLE